MSSTDEGGIGYLIRQDPKQPGNWVLQAYDGNDSEWPAITRGPQTRVYNSVVRAMAHYEELLDSGSIEADLPLIISKNQDAPGSVARKIRMGLKEGFGSNFFKLSDTLEEIRHSDDPEAALYRALGVVSTFWLGEPTNSNNFYMGQAVEVARALWERLEKDYERVKIVNVVSENI